MNYFKGDIMNENQILVLTETNIEEWKKALNIEMRKQEPTWPDDNYSDNLSDSDWISSYLGETVQAALDEEFSNWSQ